MGSCCIQQLAWRSHTLLQPLVTSMGSNATGACPTGHCADMAVGDLLSEPLSSLCFPLRVYACRWGPCTC
jgi:hypothetical protein